jgi:ligand-binding SRPBCC domain-containing protein
MRIHSFKSTFKVHAPLAVVADFHRQPKNLGVLTPPPAYVRLHEAPNPFGEGDTMRFTIWMGPFPISWKAVIEHVSPGRFVDRQIEGPFASWAHTHTFLASGEEAGEEGSHTIVQDRVDYALRFHVYYSLVGAAMALSLPLLFAYRAWKTRRLLNNWTNGKNKEGQK